MGKHYYRLNVGYTQAVVDAADIWRDNSTSNSILPTGLSISEEYISKYNAAYSDVDAYTAENVNRIITGDRPLEAMEGLTLSFVMQRLAIKLPL